MVNGNGSQPNTVQSPDGDKPKKNSFKKSNSVNPYKWEANSTKST